MCAEFESVGQHSIFGDLHLQISKTQDGSQNVTKPPYFLSFFAHECTIDGLCKVFVVCFFFLVSLKITFILYEIQDVHRFLYIYCYYKYTAKNVDENLIYLC